MSRIVLPHRYSGKVRDLYDVGPDRLLIVASDRISAFDVILDQPVPDKGRVLTGLSTFFFERTGDIVPNHLISSDPTDLPETCPPELNGRSMLVRSTRPVRMECVVRGYLFGSAWAEYTERGTVNGAPMPVGLRQAEKLPAPIFTPTTKAEAGHDLALTRDEGIALVGEDLYARLEGAAIAIYEFGARHAHDRGLVLADTKLEFGELDGELLLIDELLTPDSSRYWPADGWRPGTSPPSFDKQFVRDFLDSSGWDHTPPPPALPDDVIAGTRARYVEAYELLTDESFDEWWGPE